MEPSVCGPPAVKRAREERQRYKAHVTACKGPALKIGSSRKTLEKYREIPPFEPVQDSRSVINFLTRNLKSKTCKKLLLKVRGVKWIILKR